MTIKELSQKYSVFWFGSAVVLFIVCIILGSYSFTGRNCRFGGVEQRGDFQQDGRMMKGNNLKGINKDSNFSNTNIQPTENQNDIPVNQTENLSN